MKRSLVLAGGGMRVAWQTGVVMALTEHGLAFEHVDGTSGGILTTGMLLSGRTPREMAARWSDLNVRQFSSALDPREYLPGPWAWPGIGDADGVLQHVLPHLGIDPEKIRRSTVAGTFNVVDFATKTCVAVPHTDIDAEILAAGMSLPVVMPPLRRDGHVWTDAVWVKDANVSEALRRGAEEVWLVWCIGNSPRWGEGPLEQYVHMIEMSANGALFAELEAAVSAQREFRLHVIRPEHPLPLDTEFFTGRISADTLIAMGYRDAWSYLDNMSAHGVAKDPSCTAMSDPPEGVRLSETFRGTAGGEPIELDVTLEVGLGRASSGGQTRLVGSVHFGPWGGRVPIAGGKVVVAPESLVYSGRCRVGSRWTVVEARRDLVDDAGLDAWSDLTTAELRTSDGIRTTVRVEPIEAARAIASLQPVGTTSAPDAARVLARLGHLGLRRAFATYAARGGH